MPKLYNVHEAQAIDINAWLLDIWESIQVPNYHCPAVPAGGWQQGTGRRVHGPTPEAVFVRTAGYTGPIACRSLPAKSSPCAPPWVGFNPFPNSASCVAKPIYNPQYAPLPAVNGYGATDTTSLGLGYKIAIGTAAIAGLIWLLTRSE